jgi:hypothetical protein
VSFVRGMRTGLSLVILGWALTASAGAEAPRRYGVGRATREEGNETSTLAVARLRS